MIREKAAYEGPEVELLGTLEALTGCHWKCTPGPDALLSHNAGSDDFCNEWSELGDTKPGCVCSWRY